MRPLVLILTFISLSCGNSSGNKLPEVDTTRNALKDTALTQHDTNKDAVKDTTKLGGLWFLQPVLASDTITGKIPRLVLDLSKKRFTGNTGCNDMSGSFTYTDSTLTFESPLTTTKMNCVGYNEKAFLENLMRTNRYRLENGMLTLLFNQTELSHWTRKVAPKPVSNKT